MEKDLKLQTPHAPSILFDSVKFHVIAWTTYRHKPNVYTSTLSLNYWFTFQTNDTCDKTSLFASKPPLFFFLPVLLLCFLFVCVCLDQEAAFLSEHTTPVNSGAACGSSTLGKLCLNFEAGHVSACPQGCLEHSAPVTLQRGGQWDR